MTKKFVSSKYLIAIAAIALTSTTSVMAQADPLKDMSGYAGGGGYSPVFTPSAVAADGSYTITLSKMFGVNGQVAGHSAIRGPFKDGPTGETVYHYAVPDGAKVCVMRLGKTFREEWRDLNRLDTNKAVACGVASGGAVTFKFVKGEKPCESVNTVIDASGRFWGAHPEPSAWVVPNKNGSPRTAWCIDNGRVVTVDQHDPGMRAALATIE